MRMQSSDPWDETIQALAATFDYPVTPPIAEQVAARLRKKRSRKERQLQLLAVTLLLALLLLAGAITIPSARAAVLEWLDLGAVRIWLVAPPTAVPTSFPSMPISRATSAPTVVPLSSVLDLAGETTLDEASAHVDFPILLPQWPPDLGEPDHVFLQQAEGDMVILVWMEPQQSTTVRMSLHLLGPGAFVWKMQPADTVEVDMDGKPAFWTAGPYYIKAGQGGSWRNVRLVEGHVLIWIEGTMTYRLESDLSLEEALRIAESVGTAEQ